MTERAYFELRGRAHKRAPEALICRGLEVFAKLLFYVFFGLKFPPAPRNTLSPGFAFPGNSVDWYFSRP